METQDLCTLKIVTPTDEDYVMINEALKEGMNYPDGRGTNDYFEPDPLKAPRDINGHAVIDYTVEAQLKKLAGTLKRTSHEDVVIPEEWIFRIEEVQMAVSDGSAEG
jgi:hypothetical protein